MSSQKNKASAATEVEQAPQAPAKKPRAAAAPKKTVAAKKTTRAVKAPAKTAASAAELMPAVPRQLARSPIPGVQTAIRHGAPWPFARVAEAA
jgi:hypothetical protein